MNITALENVLQKHRVKLNGKAFRRPLACFRWDANWMGGGNPIMCYGTELLDWLLWLMFVEVLQSATCWERLCFAGDEGYKADRTSTCRFLRVSLQGFCVLKNFSSTWTTRVIAIHGGCWRETVPLTSGSELWWENSFKGSRQMAVCLPHGFRNIHLHLLRLL